jgi:hypothetical protein
MCASLLLPKLEFRATTFLLPSRHPQNHDIKMYLRASMFPLCPELSASLSKMMGLPRMCDLHLSSSFLQNLQKDSISHSIALAHCGRLYHCTQTYVVERSDCSDPSNFQNTPTTPVYGFCAFSRSSCSLLKNFSECPYGLAWSCLL